MISLVEIAILIALSLFLFYGFKNNQKRSRQQFLRTVIGVPIRIVAFILGLRDLNKRTKKWMDKKN